MKIIGDIRHATDYRLKFKRGQRVTFKDGQRGVLLTDPEAGSMGWCRFQAASGACFTVAGHEIEHTKG